MTDKPEQSAEEIVGLIISNTASQYSEEWKPDIVYTKEDLIKIVQSYANQEVKKACENKEREKKELMKILSEIDEIKLRLKGLMITGNSKGKHKEYYRGKFTAYNRCMVLLMRFMSGYGMHTSPSPKD